MLITFLREVMKMPPHELELYRSLPVWPKRVAAAHTIPRELRAGEGYAFDPGRFGQLTAPTMLLLGGDSPPMFKASTEGVEAALPNAHVKVLPGQQHIAMDTAPELFMHLLLTQLSSHCICLLDIS